MGNGERCLEKQSTYENSGTGVRRAKQERILNEKGRKKTMEKLADGTVNTSDQLIGMQAEEAVDFDEAFDATSNRLGFQNMYNSNRLRNL